MNSKYKNIGLWAMRILASVILLQTLFFKFTAAPVSVYIFSELGMEPWGRIGTGVVELIAAILLLMPRFTFFGAVLGLGLMSGAIFFHLGKLGIEVQNDSGKLFMLAVLVWIACAILFLFNGQLQNYFKRKT